MSSNRKKRVRNVKQAVVLALLLLLGFLAVRYYQEQSLGPVVVARFVNQNGAVSSDFKLELASTAGERHQGLMFRKEMAPDRGMLFIFPKEQINSFYMKNTYIPLDMIFVDSNLVVVGVLENVPILNDMLRSVGKPSQYVIELNAGVSKRIGIESGAKVVFGSPIPKGL